MPSISLTTVLSVGAVTHCPYCALQCGMTLAGKVVPRPGGLCQKGWTAGTCCAIQAG